MDFGVEASVQEKKYSADRENQVDGERDPGKESLQGSPSGSEVKRTKGKQLKKEKKEFSWYRIWGRKGEDAISFPIRKE